MVLNFNDALPYFLDEIYDDVFRMLSVFIKDSSLDDTSLSLPESDLSHTIIRPSLFTVVGSIRDQAFSSQEATAVITVLDDILFPRDPSHIASSWKELCDRTISLMVDFITINWDHTPHSSYRFNTACWVLTNLLAKRSPLAFTVFLEKQCLQFLGNHTFREASVAMVSEYVAGIFAMQHGSDGAVDAAMLQLHMDYLHNPHNLFTACSILATHGMNNNRSVIHRNIMALVQLHPRDATWDECRRKLRDLVESDGRDFFSKQLTWTGYDEIRPLHTDEIQLEKENIRYAIHVLDDFFDHEGHTVVPSELSPAATTDRAHRSLFGMVPW
ncbi:uncharacterized protein EV420DRAFT_1642932 [Desarmillaria tabescens]|uniref:Uncharacterized protein n=1 Tax=Armillaria tabescens TaxID=1929756 RepID=A0AA39N5W8_ARMTA|nr:uncharacterized protein EV420DRAFT_1642932 [Desarmillaria tabescens]KAK0458599.1 hypothetical protein EV420DRAFT_1642932 [Desarmillaria tabescens]